MVHLWLTNEGIEIVSIGDSLLLELKTRWLYYVGLFLVVANRILDQVSGNLGVPWMSSSLTFVVAALVLLARCGAVMLETRMSRVLVAVIALFLSLVSYINSGQTYLLIAALLIIGFGKIDAHGVLRAIGVVVLVSVFLLGLLQLINYLFTGELPGSVIRDGGRLRISFFFEHPNELAAFVAMGFMAYSFGWRRLSSSCALLGISVAILVALITDSRTSSMLIFVYLLFRGLLERAGSLWVQKMFVMIAVAVPAVFAVFVVFAAQSLLPDSVYGAAQSLLSGRPGFWVLQFNQLNGFTLFGQESLYGTVVIDGWTYENVTIDSFYAGALLQLGAWSLVAFYCLYVREAFNAKRAANYAAISALFCCALFGLTEIHMADFAICTPMILLGENLMLDYRCRGRFKTRIKDNRSCRVLSVRD